MLGLAAAMVMMLNNDTRTSHRQETFLQLAALRLDTAAALCNNDWLRLLSKNNFAQ